MSSLILEEPTAGFLREDAIMEVSMRDFLASLNRMLSLEANSKYFAEQFNSKYERDLVIQMLTSGDQKGGLLSNFRIENLSVALAKDP